MQIMIKFTNDTARSIEYNLQRKYHSKAKLPALAKLAILTASAEQAKVDLLNLRIKGR